jgi:formylglycine-generating enzyme required for sulfatase activity
LDQPAVRDGLLLVDIAALPVADDSADSADRRFVLVWCAGAKDEQRRLLADVSEQKLATVHKDLVKQGFAAQDTIGVWRDADGQRRYAGIWSNQGAPSELCAAYAGFELVDQPQWDMAVAPGEVQADPRATIRQQFAETEKLPAAELDSPQLLARAQARYALGQLEPALSDLDFLIEKKEVTTNVLAYRAWTLARLGKADEARAELAKYLQQQTGHDPTTRSCVQVVLAAWLGNRDEAVRLLDAAVAAAGQDPYALYSAACAAAVAAEAAQKPDEEQARNLTARSLELLAAAVAGGYDNAQQVRTDVDLAGLHGVPEFQAILDKLEPPGRYAAVWRADVEFESRLEARSLLSEDAAKSLHERARQLALEGYRPVAVAVDTARQEEGQSEERRGFSVKSPASSLLFHRPVVPDAAKEQLAKQQVAAATALLKMESSSSVVPPPVSNLLSSLLTHSPDPRLRSYLLHRLVLFGVDPRSILSRLDAETDVSRRRALILAIGEYGRAQLLTSDQQSALIADLARRYAEDPDPGVHGAAEWTLRQLGASEEIAKVRAAYATGSPVGDRRWYLTKSHPDPASSLPSSPRTGSALSPPLTFVLLHADEFLMGSPVTESERYGGPAGKNERRHRRRIGRTIAISAHEVTVVQFQAFRPKQESYRTISREDDAPANLITWYDAAAYCNWLSEREGIPKEDWCYDPSLPIAEGMTLDPEYLQRKGYRLPTAAESEYACRAGATTARYYGETEELLHLYAWYGKNSGAKWMLPVGSLRPNDYGLFDVYGNVLEWCQDAAMFYPRDRAWLADKERAGKISSRNRVLSGGSLYGSAKNVRSAYRSDFPPGQPSNSCGFRVARTYR